MKKYSEKIFKIISLKKLLNRGIICSDFPFEQVGEEIVLNKKGEEYAKMISNEFESLSDEYIRFCILYSLYAEEFLVDFKETRFNNLKKILSLAISQKQILFPWKFDNILYNKFYQIFGENIEILEHEAVLELLDSTPQGVYQSGNIIVGPLGIIVTEEKRRILPKPFVHLWHCSNPGCKKFHKVKLKGNKKENYFEVSHHILKNSKGDNEIPNKYYKNIIFPYDSWCDHYDLDQLPIFCGHCFNRVESQKILRKLIEKEQEKFRDKLPSDDKFKGSAEEIVSKLDKPECMQLILLESNKKIVNSIEELIDENNIIIPATEIRKSFNKNFLPGFDNEASTTSFTCQCSKFGIRSIPLNQIMLDEQFGLKRLRLLLKKLYSTKEEIENLNWKLRHLNINGKRTNKKYEKLDYYISNNDIEEILLTLVFDDVDKLKKSFDILRFGNFFIPDSEKEEELLLNKIIWKLGFRLNTFPNELKIFWDRHQKFREECVKHNEYTEEVKELIRSKSINFFISLEEILQKSLSFMCWVLLSDHYKNTNFSYFYKEAEEIMFKYLNGYNLSEDHKLELDSRGKNTLYPLIEGFKVLALICEELKTNKTEYRKEEVNLPFGYKHDLCFFPFLHKHLILDLENFQRVITELKSLSQRLKNIDVCKIRNCTSHQREDEDFPPKKKLERFCYQIKEIIQSMEDLGIYPMVYRLHKKIKETYGRTKVKLINDANNVVELNLLNDNFFELPSFKDPLIFVPLLKLRSFDSGLRFSIKEESNYTKMWEDFPKRLPDNKS